MITFSVFFLLLCDILSISNLQITLALWYFCTVAYLVLQEIFCMRGESINFHLIVSFFYVLYRNITTWTSPKITLVVLFIICFLQNGILFLCWEIVVWPKADQPDCLLQPWLKHLHYFQYFVETLISLSSYSSSTSFSSTSCFTGLQSNQERYLIRSLNYL